MNRIDRFFGLRGEAKVKFLNGEFQVLLMADDRIDGGDLSLTHEFQARPAGNTARRGDG
jgi:hypothetical protein